jgi:hypothetical protein
MFNNALLFLTPNFGVTSKLETDLEGMWKETVTAEFDILSRIFLRTVQVKIKKIIFSGNI